MVETQPPAKISRGMIPLFNPKLAGRSLAFKQFITGEFRGIRWEWHYDEETKDDREPRGLRPFCVECRTKLERQAGAPDGTGARFWTRLRCPQGCGRLYYDIEGDYRDCGENAEVKRLIRQEIRKIPN
jgi:hypothetical protein